MSIDSASLYATIEARKRRLSGVQYDAPSYWKDWCYTVFPKYFFGKFAKRHEEMWEWAEAIQPNVRPKAFLGIWGRGGAKSTNAEGIVIRLGSTKKRKYCWYISSTQDKADSHVENIASMLESENFGKYDSKMSRRLLSKYGSSKGWRRNRLRTANGFTVESLGLDTGARGIKIEEARPDLIVFDDVDELHDSTVTVLKKIATISKTILPSGSADCAVLFIQNLISPDSVISRLLDGRADFLQNRIVSGPHPAIENLAYELDDEGRYIITSGEATWEGQSLETCQQQIWDWGLSSFLSESQHDVDKNGGLWSHVVWRHIEFEKLPQFKDKAVWVDPAVTSTDHSDCQGISAGGLTVDNKLIGLYFWEGIDSPRSALKRAIKKAIEIGSTRVGVETDQGGDTWIDTYNAALQEVKEEFIELNKKGIISDKDYQSIIWPKFVSDKAGHGYGSKSERNQRMLPDYEKGRVLHMTGTHTFIEKSLRRFGPGGEPFDLADSWFWCWNDLLGGGYARLYSTKA